MRDREKDAAEMAARRDKMLETAFRLFSEKSIEMVSMADVAKACGYGRMTLYRYFNTKLEMVVAVAVRVWEKYIRESIMRIPDSVIEKSTAIELYEMHLDFFIDLYRNHTDLLRFNQFFNLYVKGEGAQPEDLAPYLALVQKLMEPFHVVYTKALKDGTLRTDLPEEKMFTVPLHIMMAVTTRYAVGLLYLPENGTNEEGELIQVKNMLLREYAPAK